MGRDRHDPPRRGTGAHHHGKQENVIYVIRGQTRMRWVRTSNSPADASPGEFIFAPPYVPHQEINALDDEPLECVVIRSAQEPIAVNLDVVRWPSPNPCSGWIQRTGSTDQKV